MTLARLIYVGTLQLKCCFVSFAIASPAFWDDLQKGITSLAETRSSQISAKRHERPCMSSLDLSDSMRFKRLRNHRCTEVGLASDVASLGEPPVSTSRPVKAAHSWTTLQAAGIESDNHTNLNSYKKFTESRTVPEDWESSNWLDADQIPDDQQTLPQWSDELYALQKFLGLSPDNREPAQSAQAEHINRPQDPLVFHDQGLIHIPGTPPLNDSVFDMITQHERDEPLVSYPSQAQRSQGFHEVLGKFDSQSENELQSSYQSASSHIPTSYNFPSSQLEVHKNTVPILAEQGHLLDLEPPKEKTCTVCHAPLASVGNELLHGYAKPYKEAIDSMLLEAEYLSFASQKIPFRGILATELRYLRGRIHPIRMIRVLKSTDTLQIPSRLMELIRLLLTWLIFNHQAFLASIQPPTSIRQTALKEISDWLLTEFFNPQNSLPVIGMVDRNDFAYDESAFGPVQRWIIGYLSSESGGHAAYTTSAALIGLWYKNSHKGFWQSHFNNDGEFWSCLNSASDLARKKDMRYYELNCTMLPKKHQYIGDFEVYDIRYLSPGTSSLLRKAALPKTVISNVNQIENNIIQRFTQLHRVAKVGPHSKKTYFKALSMAFIEPNPSNKEDMNFSSIRLIDSFETVVILEKLKSRLVCLLKKLNHYHAAFLKFSLPEKQEMFPDMHIKLLYWLQKVMFSPEDGLPIFGKVRRGTPSQGKMFTGVVQTYLIDFFTNSSSNLEWNQTVLAILGYWYKKECIEIWETFFKDDFGYWSLIDEALSWGFLG